MRLDGDGDVLVQRRPRHSQSDEDGDTDQVVLSEVHIELSSNATQTCFHTRDGTELLRVHHRMATPLASVGLQVWRGALLLADYILARADSFAGCVALELGAGPGVAGLVLAQQRVQRVFLTDAPPGMVLANCQDNVLENASRLGAHGINTVAVRALDWLSPPAWLTDVNSPAFLTDGLFAWQPGDVEQLHSLRYLLAADCCYDDSLTYGLMRTATLLMQRTRQLAGNSPVLLVGLERRINFTLGDLDVRAPAYDYWRTLFLAEAELGRADRPGSSKPRLCSEPEQPPERQPWAATPTATEAAEAAQPPFPLRGRCVDLSLIPQQVREYQRSEYLEVWELRLAPEQPAGGGSS